MSDEVTVSEAKIKRADLERDLHSLLFRFESETGCRITHIDVVRTCDQAIILTPVVSVPLPRHG